MKLTINRWVFIGTAALCVLLVTLGAAFLIRDRIAQEQDADMFRQLSNIASAPAVTPLESSSSDVSPTDSLSMKPVITTSGSNLSSLIAENDECIGWLSIDGTTLDYPVMHTPAEPTKYLRSNFYGEYSSAGVPFLDARCDLTNSDNLIFYGHRMKNGTMFSCLKKFKDVSYRDKHPIILLETTDGMHEFEVFAVIETTKTDRWYCFTKAVNADEYDRMITYALEESLYDTGIVPEYGERIISLSTCHGRGSDGRIIIIGKELASQ